MVGLEGTGHWYLKVVLSDIFVKHEELTHLKICDMAISCDLRQYEVGKFKYVEEVKNARRGMKEIAALEKMLPPGGGLVTEHGCKGIGIGSLPNFGDPYGIMQYPGVPLLARLRRQKEWICGWCTSNAVRREY